MHWVDQRQFQAEEIGHAKEEKESPSEEQKYTQFGRKARRGKIVQDEAQGEKRA